MTPRVRTWAALLVLLAFLCLLVSGKPASQISPQGSTREGLQVLRKMQTALGGADKLAAIRDMDWTVRADTFDHDDKPIGQVTKRTRWMRSPNLLRLDQIGPRDTYVLYFDGGSGAGWEILPDLNGPEGFKTTGQVIDLVGGELRFARSYLSGFQLNTWLADRIPGYSVTSPEPNVLRIEHGGTSDDIALDPATSLPAQILEWMDVRGVRFPARQLNSQKGDGSADIRTQKIAFNTGLIPDELATKPADFAPNIPVR